MALVKKGRIWYMAYRDMTGRITSATLGTTDRGEAEVLHRERMAALHAEKLHRHLFRRYPGMRPPEPVHLEAPEPVHQRGGLKLAEMWDVAISKRPLSVNHRKLWDWFVKRCPVRFADLVTPKIALDYLTKYYSAGNGKTYNNTKSALNTVFRCCLVEAGLSASPFAAIINKRVEVIETHRNLTEEEFAKLFDAAPIQLKIMLMLSRWTCQRLETCARMTPEMFDFERLVFMIEPGKTKRFNKWVCVPILPQLENFLRPLLKKCKPGLPIVQNFSEWQNTRYTNVCTKLIRQLEIKDTEAGKVSFHSVRGTAITWFKEHGVKGEELRAITGHASTEVEDIYARDISSLEQIAKSFHGIKS